MASKRVYVQVGVGGRAGMYYHALAKTHKDCGTLAAICDNNEGRLRLRQQELKQMGLDVRTYAAADFDRMVGETKAACVIVTTKDCHHDEYICRAMELGCDAITEKPMTTDEQKCQRIVDTQRRTGRKCTVTFNYRYSPPRTQVKDLLMSGVIGEVLSVDFQWLLDTRHGADYFRRWHRNKQNSGGLLVHKATHHFDLVNWWLATIPETVHAMGQRRFYVPETAAAYGLTNRAERCLDCPEAKKCAFYLDMRGNKSLREVYLDNEKLDGYFRDRCVFSSEIDIQDSMQAIVRYKNGATMSYSLNAFMPWEGYIVNFNGTRGRLEHICQESVYINGDGSVPGQLLSEGTKIKVYPHFKPGYAVDVWRGVGGHGGGDRVLLDQIFTTSPAPDKYKRAADQRGGAYSILTGIAGNKSIAEKRPIAISELVRDIGEPEYATSLAEAPVLANAAG